jgi:two-component system sensor histidine kinase QseC
MTSIDSEAQRSLAMTICVNFGKLALANLTVLSLLVIGFNFMGNDHLYFNHLAFECRSLLNGVKTGPEGLSFAIPKNVTHYEGRHENSYGFRVLDGTGRPIAGKQFALIEAASPWSPNFAIKTDAWFMNLPDGGPFSPHFAGGRRLQVNGTDVLIEMMTLGDPAGIGWWVALEETAEDVWLPILPLVLLMPVVTILSVRRALWPLARAAKQAEAIDPRDSTQRLELTGMPLETAAFASAINRLMERVSALVQSERVFVASSAHELRTPLAIMLLELEKIDHPRARRLEEDVKAMAESVRRRILLARLEMLQSPELVDLNLETIVAEAMDRLKAWAAAQDHKIDVRLEEPQKFHGDPIAVREALCNLVENAVKHTPSGTSIFVTVGPEATITVEDSGPGLPTEISDQLFQPFRRGNPSGEGAGLGLAIVRQAIELHRGSVQVGRSRLGGALFKLHFA